MRKNFGAKPWTYPQPVLMIAAYGEDGTPNVMNAAWGGISDDTQNLCVVADSSPGCIHHIWCTILSIGCNHQYRLRISPWFCSKILSHRKISSCYKVSVCSFKAFS